MNENRVDDPMIPVPIPEQVSAKEGMAELPGTRLGYWDTGSAGEPIVLLHPASGSALIIPAARVREGGLSCDRVFAPQLLQLRSRARGQSGDSIGRLAKHDRVSPTGKISSSELGRRRQRRRGLRVVSSRTAAEPDGIEQQPRRC